MRAFIAIDLPKNVKQRAKIIQNTLRPYITKAKWVDPANTHITLKFLGSIDDNRLSKIKAIINSIARQHSPFKSRLTAFGFLPNNKNPRILFISTSQENKLRTIALQLEEELEKIGFEKEGRFRSHITLARIETPVNIKDLEQKIAAMGLNEIIPVDELILYKSTLTKDGPIYERIFTSSLTA
jgi:RNA 2',3'-cyclic 3'-phosphodiesterase